MTENNQDERLVEQFFQQALTQEISDNGFTERVMRRLPDRQQQLSRLWTWACITVAILLFVVSGAWRLMVVWGLKLMNTLPTTGQVAQLWIALAVVTVITIAEVLRREHIPNAKTLF